MIAFVIVSILVLYVVASYVVVYRELMRNAGSSGLGWLFFPIAPLFLPLLIGDSIRRFIVRVFS